MLLSVFLDFHMFSPGFLCFSMFFTVFSFFSVFPCFSVSHCFSMFLPVFLWFSLFSYVFPCFLLFPNDSPCFLLFCYVFLCFPMFSPFFLWFPLFSPFFFTINPLFFFVSWLVCPLILRSDFVHDTSVKRRFVINETAISLGWCDSHLLTKRIAFIGQQVNDLIIYCQHFWFEYKHVN